MRPGAAHGQATLDYLAVLGIVVLVLLGSAVAVGGGGLSGSLTATIRKGICIVSGALCDTAAARRAGFAPCPIHRRTDVERTGAVALIRLERGDALLVERFSDGRASVSFVDGGRLGAELGLGVSVGPRADATVGAGVAFNRGRRYDFSDWPAAQRFLGRFAGQETTTGETAKALRRLCPTCPKRIVGSTHELPAASATFTEGGVFGELRAQLSVLPKLGGAEGARGGGRVREAAEGQLEDALPGAEAGAEGAAVLGRRTAGRDVTTYVRLDGQATAELGLVLGSLAAGGRREAVLEVTVRDGRPIRATVRGAAAISAQGALGDSSVDVGELAERLRGEVQGAQRGEGTGGVSAEANVALDLRDRANAAAVSNLLSPGLSPRGWVERARALGRRLDAAGAVDLAVYRSQEDAADRSAGVGAVVKVGAGHRREALTRDLLWAWSRRGGDALRRREDCELAAGRRTPA